MQRGTLNWILKHKVDINGISGEIQIMSGVQFIVIHQFWSFQMEKEAQKLQFVYFNRLFPSNNCAWTQQGKRL